LSSRNEGDHARLLLKKAGEDEAALHALGNNPSVADSVVGFHAQQAVEKLLKASLAARGVAYPWTHDIRHLMELLEDDGAPLPNTLAEARRLTPWSAEFRYGETIDDELDRESARRLVCAVRAWAEKLVEEARAGQPPDSAERDAEEPGASR
jgi:HEPN domain-containing protein